MGRQRGMTEFCVLSKTENVRVIGSWLKEFCEARHVGSEELEDIIIATDEAVTNIMMHGYQGRTDGLIEIRCRVLDRKVELRIRDNGMTFSMPGLDTLVNKKREEHLVKGGYGLILMHRFMDGVEFRQDGQSGKNVLLMHKNF
ncbi:MAG TPA: ATP-binding protein [Spirochaetota bacterium]|nr:ATP-binding protein [Spirochaetota bacterium]